MRILITGVHGFVGGNLVKALSGEHTIYGLDIIAPEKDGVEKTFSWDNLEQGTVPKVDAIIHLAGMAHDTKNRKKEEEYYKVNAELTKTIYEYFLESGIKKFIFFSSVKAAADQVLGDFVDETVMPLPKGPYGESKRAAEKYIIERESEAKSKHKQTYILRPCLILGQKDKGNLHLLFNVVKKGIPWPLGAFENKRTFMSVDNLCYIIKGLLSKDVESGIYHVNDDEPISTNELIDVICRVMGKKTRIWHIPKGVIKPIAKIGDFLHLPLNTERLRKLTENYISSNKKIKKALGIENLPVKAKDGLIKTIESFKE